MSDLKKLQAEIDRLTAENKNLIGTVKQMSLSTALKQAGAVKPDMLAEVFYGDVQVLDGKEVVFTDSFGNLISVEDGVSGFLKLNPELVAGPKKHTRGSIDPEKLSMDDYVKMRSDGRIK